MARTLTLSKQQVVLYSIIGPAITLLLGLIIGIGMRQIDDVRDRTITNIVLQEIKISNIEENLKFMAKSEVETYTSKEDGFLDNIVENWKIQLDKVEMNTHKVMLPTTNTSDPNYVGILDSSGNFIYKSSSLQCSSKGCVDAASKFNSLSVEGHIEGDVVFANYGTESDFKILLEESIPVKGKICIMKYSEKFLKNGERYECSAVILFKDGTDVDIFSRTLPETSIPVQVVSMKDAEILISKLGGPVAPESWWGKLPLTYRLGGSAHPRHKYVVHVRNYKKWTEVLNAIGYLYGWNEPDRYVILGSSRGDLSTAVMMEISRAMGQMSKADIWRPRRTIVFCSWPDLYETVTLAKWIEQMEKILLYGGVVYLNVDNVLRENLNLIAYGLPNLQKPFFDAVHQVSSLNPKGFPFYHSPKYEHGDFVFLAKTGVPTLGITYSYKKTDDVSRSQLCLKLGQMWTVLCTMFSDDYLLPFDPSGYVYSLEKEMKSFLKENSERFLLHNIEAKYLANAVKKFITTSKELQCTIENVDKNNPTELRLVNDKLMHFNRIFLNAIETSSISNYRNYGLGNLPNALSTIIDATTIGDWDGVAKLMSALTFHIESGAVILSENW